MQNHGYLPVVVLAVVAVVTVVLDPLSFVVVWVVEAAVELDDDALDELTWEEMALDTALDTEESMAEDCEDPEPVVELLAV